MSIYLCGQTGSINRGCEAIVRSSVKVLNQRSGDIYLATFAPEQDVSMVKELGINMISYASYPTSYHRKACALIRRMFKRSLAGAGYIAEPLYNHLKPGNLSLNIGGDTYCYGRPLYSIALNNYTHRNGIDNILWSCSVERGVIKGEVKDDLLKYKYIFAREQITQQNLLESGIPPEKVVKVCDPAFFLNMKGVPLPEGFKHGNTVGLNVSECVIGEKNDMTYENVLHLARYILESTDMSICLIPHVYSIEKNLCDWPILNQIKADLNSDRVSLVAHEYDCEQLKYIISNCRFMVCARTHASIAAYSTEVPTLVLGYSIKSKGIAMDLFGTTENYVVSYADLTADHELTAAFRYIVEHESEIRDRLHTFLPEYKKQLTSAVEIYIKDKYATGEICDKNLCSGCSACAAACPKHCISMQADSEGFLYPVIDQEACIHCDKCRKICPVANTMPDDGQQPKCYAAIHKCELTRARSSSGGVFSLLAEQTIAAGGVVFGAAFDEQFVVKHIAAETMEELEKLRGSKYVQSSMGDCYARAQQYLKTGRRVFFTGTPCQIGGLYAYLGKEYEGLLTQDIVCHGVPSPGIWSQYVRMREAKAASKTHAVSFRCKESGWQRYSVAFDFENGMKYRQLLTQDPYMQGFLAHLFLRPACHACSFKQVHRRSDITLADFWGVAEMHPDKNDDKGISLVMLHSERGVHAFADIRDKVTAWKVDFSQATRVNTSLVKSSSSSRLRPDFMRCRSHMHIDKLVDRYCGMGLKARIRRFCVKFVR